MITIYTTRGTFLSGCEGFLQTIDKQLKSTAINTCDTVVVASHTLCEAASPVFDRAIFIVQPDPGATGQASTQANRSGKPRGPTKILC